MRIPCTPFLIILLNFFGPSCDAVELVGVNVTPHQYSKNLMWRQAPDPELSARVELYFHNPTDLPQRIGSPMLFDGKSPDALLRENAWAWHDTAADRGFELPPHGLRVVRWNGHSAAWGVGTRHRMNVPDTPDDAQREGSDAGYDFEIAEPKVRIESVVFTKPDGSIYPDRMLATLRNDSDIPYRIRSCRLWLPKSNDSFDTLFPQTERTALNPYPESGVLEPGGVVGIEVDYDPLPLTHTAIEIQVVSVDQNTLLSLWSTMKIRPAAFDISGGWIANDIDGRSSLLHEPYLKTLARLRINTGQIEEVGGYTDQAEHYSKYPIKRFNRLGDRSRYDNDSMLPTIHAVEFLGEPQYGGGRPVPPQEVFDQLAPYRSWKLPTSLTLSEERTWRYYAGLSDYPHYDAYRVIAPAADAWNQYDRWNGETIRWGAPLETIGDMTRSLRQQSRPASIAYWSQGAHHDWGGFLSPRRGSPTPEELRSQAWHGLGNGIASLYWFNLSIPSLAKYPDLIDPIARIGCEIQMLKPQLETGASYEYRRTYQDNRPDWDLSSIATRDSLLMVANDLAYRIDKTKRTFQFEQRDSEFVFQLPPWFDKDVHCFRIDADGVHDVKSKVTHDRRMLELDDRVHVVGIYLATTDSDMRERIDTLHRKLVEEDQALLFDPIRNPEDLKKLKSLAD